LQISETQQKSTPLVSGASGPWGGGGAGWVGGCLVA